MSRRASSCLSYDARTHPNRRPGSDVRALCFRRLDQDEPAQVGKDQEIKALKEMNELQEFENDVWSPGRG